MGMAANPSGAHQAGRVFTGRIDEVASQRATPAHAGTLRQAPIDAIQRFCKRPDPQLSGARRPRIHKPSALVSFDLPDPLSFLVRWRAMVAADRRQNSTGKASGSGCKSGLTRHLGECNVCKDNATKAETQEIKDEFAVGLCGIDAIGGHAKPDQYGRSICRLGHGFARASGRQAFF
jgi:hypothetical protein